MMLIIFLKIWSDTWICVVVCLPQLRPNLKCWSQWWKNHLKSWIHQHHDDRKSSCSLPPIIDPKILPLPLVDVTASAHSLMLCFIQRSVPPAVSRTERGARSSRSPGTARPSRTSLRRRGGRGARTPGSTRTAGTSRSSWERWTTCEFDLLVCVLYLQLFYFLAF